MKISKTTNKQEFINELIKRINTFEKRERIVIKLPYGAEINRIEIYMSEVATQTSSAGAIFSGKPFPYVVKLTQYNDCTNKVFKSTSYSYRTELLEFIPKLIQRIIELL